MGAGENQPRRRKEAAMTKLSDTQRVILSAAAQHEMGIAISPKTLPAAARNAVFRSLIKNSLLTEINAPREHVGLGWRQDEDGTWIVARITDEGLRAIGIDPNEGDADATPAPTQAEESPATETWYPEDFQPAPTAPDQPEVVDPWDAQPAQDATPRNSLRNTAAAVLVAWDACPAQDATDNPISRAIEALRAALAGKPARTAREQGKPRKQREGTKQEQVLALLRRPEGATVAQIAGATGWAQHTVRGFFAGLKKKGHAVEVKSRERMVGPNKIGAKGSFTIYAL
jgi:hypothetical protein